MSVYITQRLKAAWQLMRERRFLEAQDALSKILKAQPNHSEANNLMAGLLFQTNQVPRALAHSRLAVTADPKNIAARQTLVSVLSALGERRAALAEIEALMRMNAGDAELAITHAGTLRDLLRYEEAVALYRESLRTYPDNVLLRSLLPFTLNYTPGVSREEVFAAHVEFGAMIDRTHPPAARRYQNDPDPERTLRVGFMSADLFTHSVAFYLRPIMEHADPARVRVHLYQTREIASDSVTARFRQIAAGWRTVMNDPPGAIADRIIADKIDVLVELNGLTSHTRALEVMNCGPAPVTATYIGYPNTTGVRSVRYRLVDSVTDPPGSEAFAVEELVRLDPCFLCYAPAPDAPPVATRPPSERLGRVTFGSFNNVQKLNDGVVRAWAEIVNAVPGARLLLKHYRLREPTMRQDVFERFRAAGLGPERVELLLKEENIADHLRLYERLDVALDPFPYNGTTTTCEAALQGVPVITLRGDRHAGRVGASLLTTIGAPELITGDAEEYVRAAVALGSDPARLVEYRATLRPRLLASPLCDGPGFARRFEGTVRDLWRRWCATRTA